MSPAMTTSDLDPDALEKARVAIALDPDSETCNRRYQNCHPEHCICGRYAALAITAYLTAREPGVTGKGEGEQ